MKKLFLATTALVALIAVPAGAADMAVKYRPAPPVVPICANFGGFYIGGHAGWNYNRAEWKDKDNFGFTRTFQDHVGDGTNSDSDWHAGVQAGYNWQANCTVFGLQADWSWTNSHADNFYQDFPGANAGTLDANIHNRWFGTVRARTGVVVDNLLLYVTGGLAYARFNRDFTYSSVVAGVRNFETFSSSATRLGWVIGAGTEWSINQNWSLVSEFMYMGFEKDNQTYACANAAGTCGGLGAGTPFRYEYQDSIWVSRIGLNYRFNIGKGVVAKY
jgi:outer membrane immunogenic protein